MDAKILTVRTTPAVDAQLRRLQGRLQAKEGRKVTVGEALEVALASVEAQWPAEPQPEREASRPRPGKREASRPQPPGE